MEMPVLLQRWTRFSNHPRFSRSVVISLFVLIFAQIVFWQPFYGVMDDAVGLCDVAPDVVAQFIAKKMIIGRYCRSHRKSATMMTDAIYEMDVQIYLTG